MGNKAKSLVLPFECNSAGSIFAYAYIGKGISKQIVKNQAKIISHVNNKQGSTIVLEQVDREIKCSLFFVIDYI